jgi:hypothetical protein
MITRQYTIWCDDRRYCGGAHLMVDTSTIRNARRAARAQGWRTVHGVADQCPCCYHRRRAAV